MQTVNISVLVQHAGWPNQGAPSRTALPARLTGTPGLVVLPGLPYFDYDGTLKFDAHPGIYSAATGERLSGRYSYCTVQDALQRASGMRGVDWVIFPGLDSLAGLEPYRQAFAAGWCR